MILGTLSNVRGEMKLYPSAIQKGLMFLLHNDLEQIAVGRHEIEANKLYASVAEYQTQPKEDRRPERHEQYIDIQYMVKGAEKIGVGLLQDTDIVTEDCLKERDVIFYQNIAPETDIILQAGMFAIYFPWDVHRPNCDSGACSASVRKIVVKIAKELL